MALLWPGQRNGQISLTVMTLLLGYRLHPAAAISFLAMRTAVFAATGTWLGIADGYRSFASQDAVFRARYTPGWPSGIWYAGTYWRKRAGVSVAAVPGTSNHGWALALDISNYGSTSGRVFRWLLDHAGAFGWSWTTGRNVGEPWHWEYIGSLTRPAGGGIVIIPEEEEDMKTIEGIFAVANGGPSWAWLNWANGEVTSVHTQKDADWIGSYMGSVEVLQTTAASSAEDKYNSKIAMLKILNPPRVATVDIAGLAAKLAPLLGGAGGLNEAQLAELLAKSLAPQFAAIAPVVAAPTVDEITQAFGAKLTAK